MRILGYKGVGLVSKLIRWQTRSEYSHVAVEMNDGTVIEAWTVGGVRHVASPVEDHNPNTPIDYFVIDAECDYMEVVGFLHQQLGKKYDWKSIIRFLTRRDCAADDRWFCSELVAEALTKGGVELFPRTPSSYITPRDVCMSPLLVKVEI